MNTQKTSEKKTTVEMNVCQMAFDYHCRACKWFDPTYRDGWCNYHEAETPRDSYCRNYG
ncbi:MAG: hypothetical protein LUI87_13465 [Lachnospiraceae bacterium]|nr:hypothetical protein [Lachnospiraceae bacterium]